MCGLVGERMTGCMCALCLGEQDWEGMLECVHKGVFVRTAVAFVSQVNGSVVMCVRRVERKGSMSALWLH